MTDSELRDRLVNDVCRMLNVRFSHWDHVQYKSDPDRASLSHLKLPSCATIYSENYGHWQALILQDMSIVRPVDRVDGMTRILMNTCRRLIKHGMDKDGEWQQKLSVMISERRKEQRLRNRVRKHLISHDGVRLFASKFV